METTILAKASIILLASVNLETISPVFLVEKNSNGSSKICLMYSKIISVDNFCPKIANKKSLLYTKIELNTYATINPITTISSICSMPLGI